MLVFGLSGGIASGKSTACRILARLCPGAVIFDADACVHRLLATDAATVAAVVARFGKDVLDQAGGVDRKVLRGRVFGDDTARKDLETLQMCIRDSLEAGL